MWLGLLVVMLALTAYANSLGNGFAYDDVQILSENPTTTTANWSSALRQPWWPRLVPGAGLYRPLTSASFAAEWGWFEGAPLGFHAVNLVLHAINALLVFILLLGMGSRAGAFVGGALFAIHPVHTEAVANVVGRAELYAAAFYLAACVLYWRGRRWQGKRRLGRLVGLGLLYFLSLCSKEIGVTLPGALLLLELYASRSDTSGFEGFRQGVSREAATWLLTGVVLLAYLGARFLVLGSLVGEQEAPIFRLIGPSARVFTAVALWFQYVRLLLFPLDLVSDYDPAVLFPSEGLDLPVILGALCVGALATGAKRAWKRDPLVTVGIVFFLVAILPVSNLLFPVGTLLAERTLYLPSVGLSLAVAGLTGFALRLRAPLRLGILACAAIAATALFVRTVDRNPAWMSTFAVLQTLNEEHPESWRAFVARAQGQQRAGSVAQAGRSWDQAVRLAPTNYTLLVQAADFHDRFGDPAVGEALLRNAVALEPNLANAYQHLAAELIRRGSAREGHKVALEGLARAGSDRELWDMVSESYVAKGDLPAAIRAREAALGAGVAPAVEWRRMAELLMAAGDSTRANLASVRAQTLELNGP